MTLARALFHSMMKYQANLEREQIVLKQIVDIGAELFAISATCSRAQFLKDKRARDGVIDLADTFCNEARLRIDLSFKNLKKNNNKQNYGLAQSVLNDELSWLEEGIVN